MKTYRRTCILRMCMCAIVWLAGYTATSKGSRWFFSPRDLVSSVGFLVANL